MASYRPKANLTEVEKVQKLLWDKDYFGKCEQLSNAFYAKKRTIGITVQEVTEYETAKNQLWVDEEARRILSGLYEEWDEAGDIDSNITDILKGAKGLFARYCQLKGITLKQGLAGLRNRIDTWLAGM